MDREHDHQHEQRHHHVFRDALQAALEVEAQDQEADDDGDGEEGHVQAGIRDHGHEAEIGVLARQELAEVVDDPAGDDGVEGHEGDVSDEEHIAHEAPVLALLLKLLEHLHGARLRAAADGKLHRHDGEAEQDQAQDVDEQEAAAAVLAAHPREFPDVAAADGAACRQHDEAESAAETFSFLHVSSSFPFGLPGRARP